METRTNSSKKIALIGNMNNNFFSMMRYLRDKGYDARLFIFLNESKHFAPECDTWEIDKWRPYIEYLNVSDSQYAIFSKKILKLKQKFDEYDIIIGCGIVPAIFYKIGIRLDIFIPYAYGIEYLNFRFNLRNPLKYIIDFYVKQFQIQGIKRVKYVITSDYSNKNAEIFESLNIKPEKLAIPMLYLKDNNQLVTDKIKKIINVFKQKDIVLFSHVAHKWKRIPKTWVIDMKRNQVLIEGFAKYIHDNKRKYLKPLLVLLEYGHDVEASKELVRKNSIEKYVLWLPLLGRREILLLLDYVNIGGGEFGGALWGGTGWEFISKGVPFFQYVKMTPEEYLISTGQPMPSFINVSTPDEIAEHLINYESNPYYYKGLGENNRNWFHKYFENELIDKYIDLIETIK